MSHASSACRPESPVKPRQFTRAQSPWNSATVLFSQHPKPTGVSEISKLFYQATQHRSLWVRAKELSLGSPKRGLNKVSFLKREKSPNSSCSASCLKRLTLGPAWRCWFIPCVCLFFYKHSCCIKWPQGLNFSPLPGKFSGMAELSLHSSVSQPAAWGPKHEFCMQV